jgi:hypothetical protein
VSLTRIAPYWGSLYSIPGPKQVTGDQAAIALPIEIRDGYFRAFIKVEPLVEVKQYTTETKEGINIWEYAAQCADQYKGFFLFYNCEIKKDGSQET